jgi:hypothetical protein
LPAERIEPVGGHTQQRVARLMTQRVVDALELIEVDIEHRDAAALAARLH